MRHEFIIKTVTYMFCFAIRIESMLDILNENPQFKQPMKRKEISCYARNVYFPLMRMKRELIEQFSLRRDYEQVICQEDVTNKGIVDSLALLLVEDRAIFEDTVLEQNCVNEIKSIVEKINLM